MNRLIFLTTAFVFLLPGMANTTLFDRGGGLIYCDLLDITLLKDTDYARNSGYDDDSYMNWYEAIAWADQLVYSGFDNWRLPDAHNLDGSGPSLGYNVTGSELGHIYYTETGNLAGEPLENTGPFENLTSVDDYWTGTEYSVPSVWVFDFDGGHQFYLGKGAENHAWAVHDGDIGAPAHIPDPTVALLLASAGMIGLGVFTKNIRRAR